MLDRAQCRDGMAIAFGALPGEEASAHVVETGREWVQFDGKGSLLGGRCDDFVMTVRVARGDRVAAACDNELTGRGIRQVALRASELASVGVASAPCAPVLDPQAYPEIAALDPGTVALDGAALAAASARVCAAIQAADHSPDGSPLIGSLERRVRVQAVASSRGNFGYHAAAEVWFTMQADATSHGWVCAAASRIDALALDALAAGVVSRLARARTSTSAVVPEVPIVLGPHAVAALLRCLERLPFVAVSESLDVISDPADARILAAPFDPDGAPRSRRHWIRGGRVVTGAGASALSLNCSATRASLADLGRVRLVGRLHDLGILDTRAAVVSGVAQAAWLADRGELQHALPDFRWTASLANALRRVVAIGDPERVQLDPDQEPMAVPALLLGELEGEAP